MQSPPFPSSLSIPDGLSPICLWLGSEQGEENPPPLGRVGKDLDGSLGILSLSQVWGEDTRLGFSSFPCFPLEESQSLPPLMQERGPKEVVGFPYRAWEHKLP